MIFKVLKVNVNKARIHEIKSFKSKLNEIMKNISILIEEFEEIEVDNDQYEIDKVLNKIFK